jgi:hypothetical protein
MSWFKAGADLGIFQTGSSMPFQREGASNFGFQRLKGSSTIGFQRGKFTFKMRNLIIYIVPCSNLEKIPTIALYFTFSENVLKIMNTKLKKRSL